MSQTRNRRRLGSKRWALSRIFSVSKTRSLEFRAEAFNGTVKLNDSRQNEALDAPYAAVTAAHTVKDRAFNVP